jgi:hypothetical protein
MVSTYRIYMPRRLLALHIGTHIHNLWRGSTRSPSRADNADRIPDEHWARYSLTAQDVSVWLLVVGRSSAKPEIAFDWKIMDNQRSAWVRRSEVR